MKNCKRGLFAIIILLPVVCISQIDTNNNKKNLKTIVFPVIARSIETGFSFGVAASKTFHLSKADTVTRTSNIQALALYSVKKQFVAAIVGSQYTKSEAYIFNETISFSSFPDKFWGIGNETPSTNEEPYSFKQYYINLQAQKNIGNHFFVGTLLEIQHLMDIDYISGGIFDTQKIAGRYPYFEAGLGGSLTYDNRTNAFSPNTGLFAQIYFNHFDKYFASNFIYSNLVVDVRKYLPINNKVLAFQLYYSGNFGDEIPIRSLATLGGSNRMRGFYEGRYRDNHSIMVQSEFRMPIYKRLGAVVFGGVGNVSSTINQFSLYNVKSSYGGGLRFAINKAEKLNIRVDYGFSSQGTSGLYFQLGEAF